MARQKALQALYQWLLAGESAAAIKAQFLVAMDPKKIDRDYFSELVDGVISQAPDLDESIAPFAHIAVAQLDPIELCTLRLACYELTHRIEVPYKVVLNEALELNKAFGATDAHKFINGVLDQLAKQLRPVETAQRG